LHKLTLRGLEKEKEWESTLEFLICCFYKNEDEIKDPQTSKEHTYYVKNVFVNVIREKWK